MGILDRLLMDEKKIGACRESVYLICIYPLASIAPTLSKNISNRVSQLTMLYHGNGLNKIRVYLELVGYDLIEALKIIFENSR